MLRVTVDMFSGRPNPSWIVDDEKEAQGILKKVEERREVVAKAESGYQGLGYRGILLELLEDDTAEEHGLPSSFMIAGGGSADESKGLEIASQLVEGMLKYPTTTEAAITPLDKSLEVPLDKDLQKLIMGELTAFPKVALRKVPKEIRLKARDSVKTEEAIDGKCEIELSAFNPGFWNNDSYVTRRNNCYNYGTNRKTNTFAQPGKASGNHPYPMACGAVTKAALSDGAHKRKDCFPDSEAPRWLMAMVVRPGKDYHWYRKHSEGFWGHKPGGTRAKNTDNRGRIVMNPETCDRGGYTDFCGYFYACKSMKVS